MDSSPQEMIFRPAVGSLLIGIMLAMGIGVWASPNAWALTASPTSVRFQAVQGGTNPPSQFISVSKSNYKSTHWTATDSANWVSVTPQQGNIVKSAQVGVAVNVAGLVPGTYSATVTVTVSKGGSIGIPVTLTVAPSSATSSTSSLTTTASTYTAYTASLTWSPSTDTTVVGYKVYMGTASGVYGPPITVGNVTSFVANNLAVATYYFVVTDYDANGSESPPSNEVSKSVY